MIIQTKDKVRGGLRRAGTRFGRTVRLGGKALEAQVEMTTEADYIPLGVKLSFISPPDRGWDAFIDQIQRIRDEFDPSFTPIARYMRFRNRATGGERTFVHLGFCRYNERAEPDEAVLTADKPHSGRMAKWLSEFQPNVICRWFENPDHVKPGSKRAKNNLPPPFIPWWSGVYEWARATYSEASARELKELLETQQREREKERETEASEAGYRLQHDLPYLKRLQESLSADDYREYVARQNGTYTEEMTPFVQVGAKA